MPNSINNENYSFETSIDKRRITFIFRNIRHSYYFLTSNIIENLSYGKEFIIYKLNNGTIKIENLE